MVDALLSACNVKQRPPAVTTSEGEPTDTPLVIKEESDSPSVLLLTQSGSARCSRLKQEHSGQRMCTIQ